MDHISTKHGYKARLVSPAQEERLDKISADRFTDPICQVDVLNESFGHAVVVWTTDGEDRHVSYIIAEDGACAPVR